MYNENYIDFAKGKNFLRASSAIFIFACIQNVLTGLFMLFGYITMIFDIVYQNEAIIYCLAGIFFLIIGIIEGYCAYLGFKNAKVTDEEVMSKCKFWAIISLICIILDTFVSLLILERIYTTAILIAAPIIFIKGANKNIHTKKMYQENIFVNPYSNENQVNINETNQSENNENNKIL